MIVYPNIDPVAFSIGSISIYWYGISYLLGFAGSLYYAKLINKNNNFSSDYFEDILFYIAIGIIFGGRFGYVLVYQFDTFISNPIESLLFWKPGRSFHGGLLGSLLALYMLSIKTKKSFFTVTDSIAPAVPIGLGFGRLGNFINGELWGRATDMPFGMIFPHVDNIPRHPSQLYEFTLEGIFLCAILSIYYRKKPDPGKTSALFLIFYAIFRIFVEFFREPDFDFGFIAFGWLTMGHVLSLPMLALGLIIFFFHYKKVN